MTLRVASILRRRASSGAPRVGVRGPTPRRLSMALSGKTIGMFVDFAYEDLEVHYPLIRLREEGAQVWLISIKPAGALTYTGKHGYPCKSDKCIDDVSSSQLDALIKAFEEVAWQVWKAELEEAGVWSAQFEGWPLARLGEAIRELHEGGARYGPHKWAPLARSALRCAQRQRRARGRGRRGRERTTRVGRPRGCCENWRARVCVYSHTHTRAREADGALRWCKEGERLATHFFLSVKSLCVVAAWCRPPIPPLECLLSFFYGGVLVR